MKNRSGFQKTNGFSLIEILLVISTIAILAVAIFVTYAHIQASRQAKQELENIHQISVGVRSTFARDYRVVNNNMVNAAHLFPTAMNNGQYTANTPIVSAWGRPMSVVNYGGYPKRFMLVYSDLPTNVCMRLLPHLVNKTGMVNVGSRSLGGSGITMENITDICSEMDETNNRTMYVFFFDDYL